MTHGALSQLRAVLAGSTEPGRDARISSGIPALDQVLPRGGLAGGSLVEWVADEGGGAVELAFQCVPALLESRGAWCVVDAAGAFSAGRVCAEVGPRRCCLIRPQKPEDAWWAAEQALRCRGVGVTFCPADAVPERVLRRWQLAAEAGGGLGMLFRRPAALRQAAWADLRIRVTPVVPASRQGRTLRLEVLYCRGRLGGQSVLLELPHATGAVRLVSELADSTAPAGAPAVAAAAARRVC